MGQHVIEPILRAAGGPKAILHVTDAVLWTVQRPDIASASSLSLPKRLAFLTALHRVRRMYISCFASTQM